MRSSSYSMMLFLIIQTVPYPGLTADSCFQCICVLPISCYSLVSEYFPAFCQGKYSDSFTSHCSFLQNTPVVHSFKEGFIFHSYSPFCLHPSFSPIPETRLCFSIIQSGASMFHVKIVRIQLKKKNPFYFSE